MPDLRSVKKARPTEARIELGDDALTLQFDAEKVTPRWMNETMTALDATDMLAVPRALAEVLLGWDLTDEGNPYPPSAANIADLSFPAVQALFEAVCVAAAPGEAEGNASPPSAPVPSSASAQTSENYPNGSASSTSLPPSVAQPTS